MLLMRGNIGFVYRKAIYRECTDAAFLHFERTW